MPEATERPGFVRKWIIAIRLYTLPSSIFPLFLGLALALYRGFAFRPLSFVLCLAGVLMAHAAANLLNDYFDYGSGVDTKVHGSSGAIVRGLITPAQALRAAVLLLLAAAAVGAYLFTRCGWIVPALAGTGLLLAIGYTAPRISLKFVALGDLTMVLAFGPLIVLGAYWVQAGQFDWGTVLWGILPGELTAAVLHANNWRDMEEDAAQGCRTVALLLGDARSAVYYAALVWFPFAATIAYVVLGRWFPQVVPAPLTVLAVLLAAPLPVRLIRASARRNVEGEEHLFGVLDARTAQLQVVLGLLLVLGFIAGRMLPGWTV
jgi:1,4-dihydroxy-2-naphthoate octaprenyltransferase